MKFRVMGLGVCLLAAAYTANAGYTWSRLSDSSATAARSTEQHAVRTSSPTAQLAGYTWSRKTGYTWSRRQKTHAPAKHSGLVKTGYTWSR